MDRRQRKTREAIYRAFTALLSEESYAKITVQQIIDRADIGRTTFYTHFDTKDALLQSFCTEIFDHVFSEDLNKEKTQIVQEIERFEKKLSNESFVAKAPANVVDAERGKLAAAKDKLAGIENALSKLN